MSNDLFVLRRPLVTEKSSRLMEKNAYSFEVAPWATKGQVKLAVQDKFKVSVLSVRTITVGGKFRRRIGPRGGYQSDWKKAIVRLKEGQQIKWEEAS
jgi:large subunit ribosomal protein L23